ncbi:hypothetical protein VNI00_015195 [Paramarasmius palmivorus]|uniref:Glycoside hydrolase family 76 protein n=1 Tax=Paramarasmius palmivorus TaxID=297713 RepID=A0AAW0BMY3_9AGAR
MMDAPVENRLPTGSHRFFMPYDVLFLLVIFSAAFVHAQLSPDPSWRKSNITISRQERVEIAARALDELAKILTSEKRFPGNDTLGDTARFFALLSAFDVQSNQTKYMDQVMDYFTIRGVNGLSNVTELVRPSNVDYFLLYGIAAIQADQAYARGNLLSTIGEPAWFMGYNQTYRNLAPGVTSLDLSNASLANATVSNTPVDGAILDGFDVVQHPDSPSIRAYTNALALKLYALLYSRTFDQMYSQSAADASRVVDVLLDRGQQDIDWTGDCGLILAGGPHNDIMALFTEGRSIYSTTQNSFDENLLRESLAGAVKTWGLIQYGDSTNGSPGEFIYNMFGAYQRLASFSDMRFSSTTRFSTMSPLPDKFYGNWDNKSTPTFDMEKQLSSAHVLVAAIGLPDYSTPTEPESTSTPTPDKKVPVGGIAGGVVGGVIIIIAALAGFFFCYRRRRSQQTVPEASPYTLQVEDKRRVSIRTAPRNWHFKDPSKENRDAGEAAGHVPEETVVTSPSEGPSYQSQDTVTGSSILQPVRRVQRDQDSGWRPREIVERLPPAYEDAL